MSIQQKIVAQFTYSIEYDTAIFGSCNIIYMIDFSEFWYLHLQTHIVKFKYNKIKVYLDSRNLKYLKN